MKLLTLRQNKMNIIPISKLKDGDVAIIRNSCIEYHIGRFVQRHDNNLIHLDMNFTPNNRGWINFFGYEKHEPELKAIHIENLRNFKVEVLEGKYEIEF